MRTPRALKRLCIVALTATQMFEALAQKRTIDEELLSGMVQAKQEEVRSRVLRNLINNTIPDANYATYNTLADVLDILTTEKNKGAMTRDMVQVIGEYAVAYGMTWYFITDRRNDRAYAICHRMGLFDGADSIPFSEWERISRAVRFVSRREDSKSAGLKNPLNDLDELKRRAAKSKKGKTAKATSELDSTIRALDLIEFHDWLLDTTIAILRDPTKVDTAFARKLRSTGLFVSSKQRSWQGTAYSKHKDLIHADSLALDTVVKALKQELKGVVDAADGYARIAKAVGLAAPNKLKGLDLTSLVGNDHFGTTVHNGGAVKNEKVAAVFDLFRHAVELYRRSNTDNRFIARLADILNRYVILDEAEFSSNERFGFSIDVEGIILSLEDKVLEGLNSPSRKHFWNLRPYFTIGLNYGAYRAQTLGFETGNTRGVPTIAWAGEKLGVKMRLLDWKYTHSREANEVFLYHGTKYIRYPRPSVPVVSNCYLNLFASGLLYSVADLRTESSYDGVLLGGGAGVTFFNDLELNLSYVVPALSTSDLQQNIDAGFWNVGFDIPIFEYIKAAREKRAKN